jgi:RimJ/RimL family protein N-acetyltransferase
MENLKSERIFLRPLVMKDSQEIFSYRSDPEVYKYQSWQPHTIADVEEFLKTRIVNEPDLPGTWFQLAICKINSEEFIGDCGMHFLKDDPGQVEIGITLNKKYQGFGYATEAMKLIFKYVFSDLKKHRIFGSVDPDNQASIRLLDRMKMRKEAHFIESVRIGDHWCDDVIYAILSREWNTA